MIVKELHAWSVFTCYMHLLSFRDSEAIAMKETLMFIVNAE